MDLKEHPERNEKSFQSVQEAMQYTADRLKTDAKRYLKIYGINPFNKKGYDLVLDTTPFSPEEMYNEFVKRLKPFRSK